MLNILSDPKTFPGYRAYQGKALKCRPCPGPHPGFKGHSDPLEIAEVDSHNTFSLPTREYSSDFGTALLGDAQARKLLEAPPENTLKGVCDRAILSTSSFERGHIEETKEVVEHMAPWLAAPPESQQSADRRSPVVKRM